MSGRGRVMESKRHLEGDASTNAIKRQRLSAEQDNHSTAVSMSGLPKVNPLLGSLEKDFLYHIGYDSHQCKETFKDVKVSKHKINIHFVGFVLSVYLGRVGLVSYTERHIYII